MGQHVHELSALLGGVASGRGVRPGPCHVTTGETAGLRQVTLGNDAVRAEILLDKGANVRQVWHVPTGARTLAESRDWQEQLAEFRRRGRRGSSYSDCYEGGWQDVLPARAQWDGGIAIADGEGVGEAAIVPWGLLQVESSPDVAQVVCRAGLPRSGLHVMKRFGVRRGSGTLRIDTTVRNASGRALRLHWTQHPALGGDLLDDASYVQLPGGRARACRDEPDRHVAGRGASALWTSGWVPADALQPSDGSPDRFTTFADVERGEAALAHPARGVGVAVRWDTSIFPHAWLWSARRESIRCVAVEPSTTYLPEMIPRAEPDVLHLLRPGESMHAWVELATFAPGPILPGHRPSGLARRLGE
jgi:galactose mutarotase-like enzyme